MRFARWCFFLAASVVALGGCKSGGGGSGGGGGSSGGSGGSTSTGTGCDQCWPQCFLDMMADCMPTGACTQESSGTTVNACYDNGVKLSTGVGPSGATLTYYKPDGSVCFTGDSTFSSTTVTATYKDPNGTVLLTDTTPISGGVQTIACGGQMYTVDPNSAACKACQTGGSGSGCTQGTCTAP